MQSKKIVLSLSIVKRNCCTGYINLIISLCKIPPCSPLKRYILKKIAYYMFYKALLINYSKKSHYPLAYHATRKVLATYR